MHTIRWAHAQYRARRLCTWDLCIGHRIPQYLSIEESSWKLFKIDRLVDLIENYVCIPNCVYLYNNALTIPPEPTEANIARLDWISSRAHRCYTWSEKMFHYTSEIPERNWYCIEFGMAPMLCDTFPTTANTPYHGFLFVRISAQRRHKEMATENARIYMGKLKWANRDTPRDRKCTNLDDSPTFRYISQRLIIVQSLSALGLRKRVGQRQTSETIR